MEFRILGPLEVVNDGRRVDLGGGRQRALLVLLLLHANEVVSSDVLVDGLWGERPPPTAGKALQNAVSQLRRTLGNGVIATRAPGYVLSVEPEAIDARRFESLVEEGRRALAAGEPTAAADVLREALGLWRGRPLAEVAYEPFAEAEAATLEESRLRALEERVEADLALGRHADLVGELERLVSEHPLRERPRGQLMLALYRSGRQAEALEVYQFGRRLLAEDLGLEPGGRLKRLEKQILTQDPALEPPPLLPLPDQEQRRVEPATVRKRRVRRLVAGLTAVVVAGAVALAAFLLSRENDAAPTVVPNSLVKIDPRTNKIVEVVRVGRDPILVAATGRWVFVTNLSEGEGTVSRVDVHSEDVETVGGLRSPRGLAAAPDGTVWIGSDAAGEVTQLNPPTLGILRRLRLKLQNAAFVAVGGGSLWVSNSSFIDGSVLQVRLPAGSVAKRFAVPPAGFPVQSGYGEGKAWFAVAMKQALMSIGARDGTVRLVSLAAWPSNPAVGFHAVWIASSDVDRLYRVDPLTMRIDDVVTVGDNPTGVATGADAVWVTNEEGGTVSRIDPRTNEVVATIRTGYHPHGVVVAGGAVWVAISARRLALGGGLRPGSRSP